MCQLLTCKGRYQSVWLILAAAYIGRVFAHAHARYLCRRSCLHVDTYVHTLQQTPSISEHPQDPEELYLELADKVGAGLSKLDPYFEKLARGMKDWIACWRQVRWPSCICTELQGCSPSCFCQCLWKLQGAGCSTYD